MFGLKAPGSLYWFNVSLIVMFVMSFQALTSGSFPGYFFVVSLFIAAIIGRTKPCINGEGLLRNPKVFILYGLCLLLMCNVMDHAMHKPVSFSGVISTILAFVIGLYLGRYIAIGRFSINPEVDETESVTEPL